MLIIHRKSPCWCTDLKHLNQALVLLHYYKNSPPISKSWIRACDEPWPNSSTSDITSFWPKLASTILNCCGRKRSFNNTQIRVIGLMAPELCTKMLKKLIEELKAKISCHYTLLLHCKNCPSRWHFLRSFLTAASPVEGQSLQQKKRKGERGRQKKIQNRKA